MSIGNDYSMPAASLGSVMDEARHKEMVQHKIALDAVRQNIGDGKTKDKQLRTTCEDFESIFIQKIWEQMRKNVRKEGYLHSKDEEAYQSLFDVELAKKMSSAGGIGLADMLYEQLSQQMTHTARATASSTPLQGRQSTQQTQDITTPTSSGSLTAKDLYSPLPEDNADFSTSSDSAGHPAEMGSVNTPDKEINAALVDLQKSVDTATTINLNAQSETSGAQEVTHFSAQAAVASAAHSPTPVPEQKNIPSSSDNTGKIAFANTSWHTNTKVSAKPKGISPFPQNKKSSRKTEEIPTQNTTAMSLPHSGQIISPFGWDAGTPSSSREWNPGIRIAAQPGDPVKSVKDGTVIAAGQRKDIGEYVTIAHDNNLTSTYGNIDSKNLPIGTEIKAGTFFAKISINEPEQLQPENISSLYYEIKRGEMALNPLMAIQDSSS